MAHKEFNYTLECSRPYLIVQAFRYTADLVLLTSFSSETLQ